MGHLTEYPEGYFEVILIDGMARISCTAVACAMAADETMIIVDNSDWPEFWPCLAVLEEAGFFQIDFAGPAPGASRLCTTTVATRDPSRWLRRRSMPRCWGYDLTDYPVVEW